jgi:eukaryotic-like serine/threonine-protein kinase
METLPSNHTSSLGTVLASRYELRARIGRGGMGEVFEAVDRRLDRTVAVKVLRPELASDRRFPARLRREARTVAGLAHPGIVSVHDFGEDGERVFIVMELVAGKTLHDLLRDEGLMSPARVARIGVGAAQALSHAHARGVVHRDVSPTNVMVTASGQVKVLDFGIARAARGSSRPGSGSTQGTLAYVAPERLRGGVVDHRADLFSLGAVLAELVTGSPNPTALPAELPPRLATTLRRCLHPNPNERFDDAGELAEELWKVSMVAPEVAIARPALTLTVPAETVPADPDRTVRVPRVATTRLPPVTTPIVQAAVADRRRRPGRVVAALALAAMAIGAALVAGPTLASMNDGVTPHVKGPRPVPAPSDLSAAATCDGFMSTGVDLAWTSGPRGERASGYEVWRRGAYDDRAQMIAWIGGPDVTSYRDIDLGVDTSYTYSIRAVDGVRVSRPSDRVDVATPLLCLT